MEIVDATGGASKASDKCPFAMVVGDGSIRCNGRSELYSVIT